MKITPANVDEVIGMILKDPGCSYWVQSAVHQLLDRDPVDAWKDAHLLEAVFRAKVDKLQGK